MTVNLQTPMTGIVVVFVLVLLDQVSKFWALHAIPAFGISPFVPGVQFTLTINHGVAFGWFATDSLGYQLSLITIALIMVGGTIWARRWVSSSVGYFALLLLASGAIGNAMDRFLHGGVIDFIDCFFYKWHWYAFNLADVFICLGACAWLYGTHVDEKNNRSELVCKDP